MGLKDNKLLIEYWQKWNKKIDEFERKSGKPFPQNYDLDWRKYSLENFSMKENGDGLLTHPDGHITTISKSLF